MFCSNCGTQLNNSVAFCPNCGERIKIANAQNKLNSKKNIKKPIVIVISIFLCICIIGVSNILIPKRASFDFDFQEESIEKFMEKVCENADVEYAKINSIDKAVDRFDDISYGVYIDIKIQGYTEEQVYITLENEEELDTISYLTILFWDSYSENYINCVMELSKAIEKTICGNTKIESYFNQFYFNADKEIANYTLASNVSCKLSSGWNCGSFTVYRT